MNLYQKYNQQSVPVVIHVLLCVVALGLWLLLASILLPFLFLFSVFKWSVAAWIIYNRFGKLLASQDEPYMHEFEEKRNYNVCMFMLNGKPDIVKLRKLFNERVVMNKGHPSYKRLKQTIVNKYGHYVWTDEIHFDISNHVQLYDGAPPASEQELKKVFGEITSKALPDNISPWQLTVIPMENDDHYAFLCRVHHIIGDGISMVNVFSKVMDDKPVLLKPSMKSIKKYKMTAARRLFHAIFNGPLSLLTLVLSSSHKPFQRIPGNESETKVAWTDAISLPKIKLVKNKIGATINDVLTGCLAGALRRYLKSIEADCSKDVQIAMSINTRPPSLLLEENIPLENNSTGVIMDLPVKEESLLERIELSKKRMDVIKSSSDFLVFGFIFNQVLANLPNFLTRLGVNSLNRHASLILSNVPGPLNKMVIGGDEVESIMVWPPLVGGTPMTIAIFSYADTVRLNVKVDSSVVESPKKLTDFFQMEIDELFEFYCKKDD